MCVNVLDLSWDAFPLFSHQEMHLQKGSVHCICSRISLLSLVSGGGTFTLVLPGSGITNGAMVLLQVHVAGPSVGEAVTALMRMLEAAALFSITSTSLDRQSVALLQVPDIHSTVIL